MATKAPQPFPLSYKAPEYSTADAQTSARLGLPAGMLEAIRTVGEKSNADQVSSAGARTPYQIIPSTRDAILKQYGIDAYLSPEMASEAAGILLRDSLKRNDSDPEKAVREYHGGTNPSNWGKINQAYWGRVSAAMRDTAVRALSEDFGKWVAANPAQPPAKAAAPSAATDGIANDFAAWLKGGDQIPGTPIPADRVPPALGLMHPKQAPAEPGMMDKALGVGEAALSTVTGMTSGALGAAGGLVAGLAQRAASGDLLNPDAPDLPAQYAQKASEAVTYAPRTEMGQQYAKSVGDVMQQVLPIAGLTGMVLPGSVLPVGNMARGGVAAVLDKAATGAPVPRMWMGKEPALMPAAAEAPAAPVKAAPVKPAAAPEAIPPEAAAGAVEAGRPVPSLEQYVALRKLSNEPMAPDVRGNFLSWIKKNGGISAAEKLDITGDANGVRNNPAGIFRRGGSTTDDLASRAADEGYLRPDMAGDTGAFVDLVKQAIGGERVLTMQEQMAKAGRDSGEAFTQQRIAAAEKRAKALGVDPAAARGDVRALEAYLDKHESALLSSAVDEARGGAVPVEADVLAQRAQIYAQDIQDSGRTLAQYEAEIGRLSPVMRKLVADQLGEKLAEPAAPSAAAPVAPAAGAPALPRARPASPDPQFSGAMSAEKLAQTAKAAGEGGMGGAKAAQVLAEQAAPNRATVKAAQRLGIADHLQADHVTTNEAYRQIVAAVKSNPQSKVALAEREGLARIAERATELIDEIGGTTDAAALDAAVKGRLKATQMQLDAASERLYGEVKRGIPAKAEAPADAALAFVSKRADELGGVENLSSLEQMVARKLQRDNGAPTYALLDDVRRDVGAAMRKAGEFKDADTGLAKQLYKRLSEDQSAVAERHGMREVYDLARKTVAQRKAIEDDLVSLFGRDLDQSIAGSGKNGLRGAFAAVAQGDAGRLGRLLSSIPEDMRQQVVASGLATMFRNTATRGGLDFTGFAKQYESLKRNRQAYAAVFSNLPLSSAKQMESLYRVSSGISESLNRRTKTGALTTIKAEMMGTDSLMENLFSVARRSGAGLAAEAVTTPLGLPGAGLAGAIASALTKGKPKALAAIDELIASPEFEHMARQPSGPAKDAAVKRLAASAAMKRFALAVGNPREMRDREGWLVWAMQPSQPNQNNDRRQPATGR